jgi:hypothetical protein
MVVDSGLDVFAQNLGPSSASTGARRAVPTGKR